MIDANKLEFEYYNFASLPIDLVKQAWERACKEIENYTVSLIFNQKLIGSGTLVSAFGQNGILTAHHVARLLYKSPDGHLGINIAGHVHQFFISVSHIEHCVVGDSTKNGSEQSGPDISFLRILDVNTLATLGSKKSFFQVVGKDFNKFKDIAVEKMDWFVAGAPDEMSKFSGEKDSRDWTLSACHFIAQSRFQARIERGGFDYVDLEIISGDHGFPKSYGGVSGGGIWLVPLTIDPDKGTSTINYDAPMLMGVAFFQSEPQGDKRIITGHGPASIYTRLCQSLQKKD